MDATAALDEVAFLLERERSPRFKVQAFRRASSAIADLDAAELAERIADGRLQAMKGIGDRTFEIIRAASAGEVPSYLAALRERAVPLAPAGASLRARLRGDLHTHSDWSDGTTSIDLMVDGARQLGHEYLALTDHSPNLKVARGLDATRLRRQLGVVRAVNKRSHDLRLLSGIETDILEDGTLDQDPALLEELDVVVASVHSKLRADRATMTRRMLGAIRTPRTNILGHVTGRMVEGSRKRPESEFDARAVFAACAEHGVAVEINARPERQDPPDDLIALAIEAGCLFSIDSDAHAPGQLAFLDYGAARAVHAKVPADRIVTTWPTGTLLDWLRRR